MAKAANNLLLQGVSGKLGGIVIRQMRDGSVRLSAKPDFRERRFSSAQKAHQKRFKQAAAYASQAAQINPVYAELAARTMSKAYNIALSDWFHPPVIHRIERRDGHIHLEASDDVLVARVHVQVLDEDGQILEEGEALQPDPESIPEWWKYLSGIHGTKIIAEAWDLAGNRAESVL